MTITVTHTEYLPNGNPWAFATFKIGLVGSGWLSGGGGQVQHVARVRSDVNGVLHDNNSLTSFSLLPNNTGEAYVLTTPDRQQYTFQVPASGGPYTLQALLVTGEAPAADPATTQAAVAAFVAAQMSGYVPRPGSGDATGSVPTKQSDGSVAYAVPFGGSTGIAYDTDGVPYLTI